MSSYNKRFRKTIRVNGKDRDGEFYDPCCEVCGEFLHFNAFSGQWECKNPCHNNTKYRMIIMEWTIRLEVDAAKRLEE